MSSVWASLSGIRSHQFMLDVIGNNLANANTPGFKASHVNFAEMMNQTLRPAASGTESLGGTNPVQIGLGVQVGTVTRDFTQGGLQDTGNPLDLAIDGRGFMVVHDGSRMVFKRTSTFGIDSDNNLVDTVTGYRLLNVDNEPVTIPYDEQIPAQQTRTISIAGNLSTAADVPSTEVLISTSAFTSGGSPATSATDLNALDATSSAYSDGDTILITGTDVAGDAITPVTFTYGAGNDGTTIGDLIDAINSAFSGEATCSLDSDGNLLLTADEQGDASLSLTIANDAGSGVTDWDSHALYVQTDGSDGGARRISASIYDSRGMAHVLTLTFERAGEREWNMVAQLGDEDGTLISDRVDGIRFNTDGSFNSVVGGSGAQQIVIDYGGAAEQQTISLWFGSAGSFDGLTAFGGPSTAAVTDQDGYAAGTLKSFSIGRDGMIEGVYTNGQRRDLAQILVATFDNPEGLENVGQGVWAATINSGDPVFGTALTGRAGGIVSAVLEASNVESAEELTRLIIAQHGFQLSTRAMAVSNRIIQELATVI